MVRPVMASEKKPPRPAYVLAIGTAPPAYVIHPASYPDLREKFNRISLADVPQDSLRKNKRILTDGAPSLDAQQDSHVPPVSRLGKEAASVAIMEWGQPKEKITHLMFHSTSVVHMPGADCRFIELLGLPLDVKRTMLYHQGSYVSGTLLRMAKDAAENNAGARILIVCSEIALGSFQGPCKDELGSLLAQEVNSNGAAALIVGADPYQSVETPLFELMSASQMIIPVLDGENELISRRAEGFLRNLTVPFGMEGHWNSFFWAIHTGSRAILDSIEENLELDPGKLHATRQVLSEYGNIGSASVFFVLDEIRRRGGKGMKWGILFAFGAGVTLDAVLLRRTLAHPGAN